MPISFTGQGRYLHGSFSLISIRAVTALLSAFPIF